MNKIGKELTAEQKVLLNKHIEKWLKINSSTGKCDPEKAKAAAIKCYELVGAKPPEQFFIYDCPVSAAIGIYCLKNDIKEKDINWESPEIRKEILNENINNQIFGCMDSAWLCFYDFFIKYGDMEKELERATGLIELAQHCGWWAPYEHVCILQHKPKAIHKDAQGRLHNLNGPAIEYFGRGLSNLYCINGITVDSKIIERKYTWKDIDKEQNAEIRRIMVELYGEERYVRESNAQVVHRDDFGTLYKKPQPNDEDIWMVEVVNSTPQPDGTFRNYWLPVDPSAYGGLKTARAAVASTWRHKDGSLVFKTPEEYNCTVQT